MSIERKIVLVRAKAVLVQVETVLVRVKMAEVLTSDYSDCENHIQSVILKSELTMVVREKLCIHPWILFSNEYCCFHMKMLCLFRSPLAFDDVRR